MAIENSVKETWDYLNEMRKERRDKYIQECNNIEEERQTRLNEYYSILENRELNRIEKSRLLEDAKNNYLNSALKAIYITALESETLTDDGLALAESMVENYVKGRGGATKLMNEASGKSYLLDTIFDKVIREAQNEVDRVNGLDNEKVEIGEQDGDPFNDYHTFIMNKEEKNGKRKSFGRLLGESAYSYQEIFSGALYEDDNTDNDSSDDSDSESNVEDTGEEDGSEDVETNDNDDVSFDDDDNGNASNEDEQQKDESEVADDSNNDESETSDDKSGNEEQQKDESEVADDSNKDDDSDETSDDNSGEDDESPSEDDSTEDSGEETEPDDAAIDAETNDNDDSDETSDDNSGEDESEVADDSDDDEVVIDDEEDLKDDSEEDDKETETKPPKDTDDEFLQDLDQEEDVKKAVELIRNRVADAEQDFIKRNAEDKKKIDELLGKISDNVKTVKDIADDNTLDGSESPSPDDSEGEQEPSTEEKIAQETVQACKRMMHNITENKVFSVYEKFARNLSTSIMRNQTLRESYTVDGSIDFASIMESTKVMYAWLETVNTLQLEKVDSDYIKQVLDGIK